MEAGVDREIVDRVLETTWMVVAGAAISSNGHGNVSIEIEEGMKAAALQRAMAFEGEGTRRA